jgi:putative transposase
MTGVISMMARGKGKGKWVRRGVGEQQALLLRYERSGLEVSEFCRREGISAASFYRWRAQRGAVVDDDGEIHDDAVARAQVPAFVDLGALGAMTPARARLDMRLDLGDGVVLHLVRG